MSEQDFIADGRRLRERGIGLDDTMAALRAQGASVFDVLRMLVAVEGVDLGQAKIIVDESRTWSDFRRANERLRDSAEEALTMEADQPPVDDDP